MDLKDIVAIIKDVIVAIAAAATAIVAIIGINGWRRETQGKARFDCARTLLLAAYQIRDDVENCRRQWFSGDEFPPNTDMNEAQHADAYATAFGARWARVRSGLAKFDIAVLDAEVVLGPSIKEPSKMFRRCVQKLSFAIDVFLSNVRTGKSNSSEVPVFGLPSDPYGQEVMAGIESLERIVGSDLRRKRHDALASTNIP